MDGGVVGEGVVGVVGEGVVGIGVVVGADVVVVGSFVVGVGVVGVGVVGIGGVISEGVIIGEDVATGNEGCAVASGTGAVVTEDDTGKELRDSSVGECVDTGSRRGIDVESTDTFT